ncbi:MAG TPA: ExbD/TolR family protein [Methylophilaceae bacterium]|jgi:biopolymer transport protein TolR|nr:ExbD/TolR family protein [Methylophilaceae bacterium]
MSRRKHRRMMNQINVVPYIDVMLVLLVIFMVTAPLTNPGVVELPQVGQALKQASAPLVVSIRLNGKAEIEGKTMERDQLLFEIRSRLEKDPQRSVVVAADEKVEYGKVAEVMDMLKMAKVEKVGLLFEPAP